MLSPNEYIKEKQTYDSLYRIIEETEANIAIVMDACRRLCNLEISHKMFECLLYGQFGKSCINAMNKRFIANSSITGVKEKLQMHETTIMNNMILSLHCKAVEHMSKYVSDYLHMGNDIGEFRLSYARKFLSSKRNSDPEKYIKEMQSFLENHHHHHGSYKFHTFEVELCSYQALIILVKIIIEREYQVCVKKYENEVEALKKKYNAEIILYNTHIKEDCTDEHIALLEKLAKYERERYYLPYPLIRYCNEWRSMEPYNSLKYENLQNAYSKNDTRYKSEIKRICFVIAKQKLNKFIEQSFKKKCLLTEKSINDIVHNETDENLILFVLANNAQVHHRTLFKIALTSKYGYMLVYEAMGTRLRESGPFHPLFIKNWHTIAFTSAIIEETRQLQGGKVCCRVIATKESLKIFKYRWESNLQQNNIKMLNRLQTEMTPANKIALWAFRLSHFYYDMIYAIQTRYQHIYIEFEGNGQEKASKLFRGSDNTSESCSLVFKLDDNDIDCYILSFIVVHQKKT